MRKAALVGGLLTAGTAALMVIGATAQAQTTSAPAKTTSPFSHSCATPSRAGYAACLAMKSMHVKQPAGFQANAVNPYATPSGFGPSDLRSAYNLAANGGAGQTVAIVDAYDDPNAASDLAAYRAQFGLGTLASGQFKKVSQTGSTTSLPSADAGWAEEESLDVDMVSAIAPKANIILVEGSSASFANLGKAVNEAVALGAKFVSNSYGGSDSSSDNSYTSSYYHHDGVAITASTGDGGYGVEFPASSQYVTAVGGTSLTKASNTRGWTETAWSGAGSGCSSYSTKGTWQTSVTSCTHKANADVSAVADPNTGVAVYDTYGGDPGWEVFGGTSVSSPIIAAVYADAGTPGTSDSPAAYPWAHTANLNDVTSGSNGSCTTSKWCKATTGWDGPTGLGTPNGTTAFHS
jgi:subtilase family serine protease